MIRGTFIAQKARILGTDRGFSSWLLDKIARENYEIKRLAIKTLRRFDSDLDVYLKKASLRKFTGKPFKMYPIVSSEGEVIDGYNRIHQQLLNGSKSVYVYLGVTK